MGKKNMLAVYKGKKADNRNWVGSASRRDTAEALIQTHMEFSGLKRSDYSIHPYVEDTEKLEAPKF